MKLAKCKSNSKPYLTFTDTDLVNVKKNKLIHFIIKVCEIHNIPRNTIIDFGCGHGNISLGLSYYFEKVYSFDVSEEMISNAKQNIKRLSELNKCFISNKIILKKQDFNKNISIKDFNKVNIILLNNSIHYAELNKIDNIINNLLKILCLHGLIIIIDPWKKTIFGDNILNKNYIIRKKKLDKIEKIRDKLIDVIKKYKNKIITIKNKISSEQNSYYIILKKI